MSLGFVGRIGPSCFGEPCQSIINMDGPGVLYLNRWDKHHSGTPISNFAVPKFDKPAVFENNVEVRAIPRPIGDEAMRIFELLVRATTPDGIGTAKHSHNLLPRHARFEAGHLLAGCTCGEKSDNREG